MISLLFIYRVPIRMAADVDRFILWPDTNTAVQEIKSLLRTCDSQAQAAGYSTHQISSANLAVIGLIDERVNLAASRSASSHRYSDWLTNTLGGEVLRHGIAGQRFFEELQKLLDRDSLLSDSDAKVLELYTLCLRLGFKGKYNHSQDEPTLHNLIDESIARLETNAIGEKYPALVSDIVHPKKKRPIAPFFYLFAAFVTVLIGYATAHLSVGNAISSVHSHAATLVR